MAKYVFICGSVVSSIGKGTSAASLNLLMKMRGLKTEIVKFDPYHNSSASLLNPTQHGNTVVLSDGTECDLDMTHYYSLGQADLSSKNIWTSGRLHEELLNEEKKGKWLGATLQCVPHISGKIQDKLIELGKNVDLVICEIGGTVSDNESWIYYEAIRDFKLKIGNDNVVVILIGLILWLNILKEFKTKPFQRGISDIRSFGLEPDLLICRSEKEVQKEVLDKISELSGIDREAIFNCADVECIYQIPLEFYDKNIDDLIIDKFRFKRRGIRIKKYRDLVERYINSDDSPTIKIGVLGKYTSFPDTYFTIKEALIHAAITNNCKINIKWINSEELEISNKFNIFDDVNAVVVPGGFGNRGIEGIISGIKHIRENNIPSLLICLGLQCSVIEFCRNVCDIKDANSQEFDKNTKKPVVYYMKGQEDIDQLSGTLRLGAFDCELEKESASHELYKKKNIKEIHRHRLEINPENIVLMQEKGFKVAGRNNDINVVEIMELEGHPYFIGAQFHPEYLSRINESHPLFNGLIKAALKNKEITK